VAEAADVVFSMVTDTVGLDAVTRGADGILAGLRRGAVYVEMSTVDPGLQYGHGVGRRSGSSP
jgi:2-hydroxy-3-oxopropionate reductase